MTLFSKKPFRVVCAMFAFFVFTGDLVADAVEDATGAYVACLAQSQSGGHNSSPACSGCVNHTGAALANCTAVVVVANDGAGAPVTEKIEYCEVGSPAAIDHPPQLA